MSIYKQCSKAASKLTEDPSKAHGGVFTEIDVVQRASKPEWSQEDYKEAHRQANQVLGTRYRERKVCRFGPVTLPDGNNDYGRIASKIVYAAADGPESWETPNGSFLRMMIEGDEIGRQGRRFGTERTDLVGWGGGGEETLPGSPDHLGRRIARLEKSLNESLERLQWLESIERKRRKIYSAY